MMRPTRPQSIHPMGPRNGQPFFYVDARTGTVGRFMKSRRRPGHGTRDRNFKPVITLAEDFLFTPTDGSAAYWVERPEFSRHFRDEAAK